MEGYIVVSGVVAVIVSVIMMYNNIVKRKNNVARGWADVLVQQRKKNNVLPQIEKMVQSFVSYERQILEKVTALRSAVNVLDDDIIDHGALRDVDQKTKFLATQVKVVAENYPELKASDMYRNYMNTLEEIEDNVAAAITIFNREVQLFNDGIQTFPSNVVNQRLNKEVEKAPFTNTQAQKELAY